MSTIQSGGYDGMQYEPVEQRTSVMAILSLVFGLLCLPVMGVLGVIFGIAALFSISASRGRLGGKGVAVAGLVISVLVTVIWVAVAVGGAQVYSMFNKALVAPATATMQAIEAGQPDQARNNLSPSAALKITDADFAAFREAYQAELGAYTGTPQGIIELATSFGKVGPLMQKYQQNNGDIVPLPANFEKGMGLMVFQIDKAASKQGGATAAFINVIVVAPSQNSFTLYDPANRAPAQPSDPLKSPEPPDAAPAEPPTPPTPPSPPTGPG